uniref:Uncharacterized protein n=1 Tax=Streptomyces sp. NBC_00093 TaxID=2975649 RepID=A0AAU2AB95_9ACTN
MITASAEPSLVDVREALRIGGLRQVDDCPGLPVVPDVETWLCDAGVIVKITIAPEERPGADTIPARLQDVLRVSGLALAAETRGDNADAALVAGKAVRIVRAR